MYIYVGNLSTETAGVDLRREFEAFGEVTKAAIITDQGKVDSAGFGIVKMASQIGTNAALTGMIGKSIHGRTWEIRKTRRVAEADDSVRK
ncbi:MAG: RNA-binding protein [Candidatus Zixiibacteriota bacterium]